MNFEEWWDTTKAAGTPFTFQGWEQSCRQAWEAARKIERVKCIEACQKLEASFSAEQKNFRNDIVSRSHLEGKCDGAGECAEALICLIKE